MENQSIDHKIFNKIVEFKAQVQGYCEPWKADVHIEIISKLVVETEDTSYEERVAVDEYRYRAGAVSQCTVSKLFISIWVYQRDEYPLINKPITPTIEIPIDGFNFGILDYHNMALKGLLCNDDAPTELDWKKAAEKEKEQMENQKH